MRHVCCSNGIMGEGGVRGRAFKVRRRVVPGGGGLHFVGSEGTLSPLPQEPLICLSVSWMAKSRQCRKQVLLREALAACWLIAMPRLRPESHPTLSEELRVSARLGNPAKGGLPESEWPRAWKEVYFKDLEQLPRVTLETPPGISVLDLISRHESTRAFLRTPLSRTQLTALLGGISLNRVGADARFAESRRTYPSAGARYPVDTYLLVLRCRDVGPGAYQFDPRDFSILQISDQNFAEEVAEIFGESWTADASLIAFFVAQWQRTQVKYGDRGYGYAFIEAGHMAQNMILVARQLGLRVCPMGGFWEERVEKILRLVSPEESPLYALVIGVGKD